MFVQSSIIEHDDAMVIIDDALFHFLIALIPGRWPFFHNN